MAKCVLAYSGGLDTSVCIKWLKDKKGVDVIAVSIDVGEERDYEGIRRKAEQVVAVKALVVDAKEEFFESFISRAIKANLLYEGRYPAFTSLARPLLARKQVEVARAEGAEYLAHGCTGQGNDQVRFEVTFAALAPQMSVIAPLRIWEFTSREQEIAYAMEHNIPVSATKKNPYSIDENIWGISIECGVLEDPMVAPPADAYQITTAPEKAPDEPTVVDIEFVQGVPVALDGQMMEGLDLIVKLNELGAKNGVGRLDMIENRVVGIKSREIYEAPAATILHFAHRELERLTLEKSVFQYKKNISQDYANIIYNGTWFSPMRQALDAFVDETQKPVTGMVRLKLYKGNVTLLGRTSPNSLYNEALATYTEADTFDHKSAEGFIKIYGLGLKTFHEVNKGN